MAADDHGASPVAERRRYRRQVNLRDVVADLRALPTTELVCQEQPETSDSGGPRPAPVDRLLPTPAAVNPNDGEDPPHWLARQARQRARRINGNGMGMPLSVAVRLLPTPLAAEARSGSPNQRDSSGQPGLTATVLRLLPTPRATGNRNSRTAVSVHRSGPGLEQAVEIMVGVAPAELAGPVEAPASWTSGAPTDPKRGGCRINTEAIDWGDYTLAIHRWAAVLDRAVPRPTEPGRTGRPRLAPVFVEWLMGLQAGWVTHIDITRAAQLRTLGNGVVPAQAATAINLLVQDLIHGTDEDTETAAA